MNAPLVVNTKDGVCWTRRTVTSGGIALYAPESVKTCPDFVMATEAELAEHGIVGSAFALPVPVGPEQQASHDDRAKAPWGRGEDGRPLLPMGAHWTDVPELVDRTVASIQARVDQAQSGHWYDASATETWRAPGTVCTRVDGYHRTVGQFTNVLPADLELVLHAHSDLSWCLETIAKFRARVAELEAQREHRRLRLVALQNDALSMRGSLSPADGDRKVPFELGETLTPAVDWLIARVAELEAERHSTNESLSETAETLRANRDRITELEAAPAATYRAEQHAAGLILCTYSNLAAAQAHCEDWARLELGSAPTFDWIPDDEDDPAVWELVAQTGDEESETGFSVTVADIAAEYDPDGDE